MKPRYFKYWAWRTTKYFEWYRIKPDGIVEKRKAVGDNFGKWYAVKDGYFARLDEENLEEISEEDYFLDKL